MKNIILMSLFTVLFFVTACNFSDKTSEAESFKNDISKLNEILTKTNKNLVLVELFTSEG